MSLRPLVISSTLLVAAVASAAEPWDAPFAADVAGIARAAARVPRAEEPGATILLQEQSVRFEADGRATTRLRLVWRVDRATAIEDWAEWAARWLPFRQERPTLRARVISPDGQVRELDPNTVEERSLGAGSGSDYYGDAKLLRAPLPAVTEGALVEVERVVVDRAPLFAAGTTGRFELGSNVPTQATRLRVEAPTSLPLAVVVREQPGVKAVKQVRDGRVAYTVQLGPLPALPPQELGSTERSPHVAWSTGRSWAEVAASYARLVDAQLAAADVSALAREARGDATSRQTIADRLVARVRKDVRYAAVELRDASLVPRSPSETLARRFGDCKDQATLLVALLRASGVPAWVALLDAGVGEDVDPSLPGMAFDHAIVLVPGGASLGPDLWIDPTARYTRAGDLPTADRGRRTLVARAGTTGLVVTPPARASDSTLVESRTYELREEGEGRAVEDMTVTGAIAAAWREHYDSTQEKAVREALASYAASVYKTRTVDEWRKSDPNALDRPFSIHLVVEHTVRASIDREQAVAAVFPGQLLAELPFWLKDEPDEAHPRRTRYRLSAPLLIEQHVRIVPPPGYVVADLPAAQRIPVGPWHIELAFSKAQDGSARAELSFRTEPAELSASEYEAVRRDAHELTRADGILLHLPRLAEQHFVAGRLREAIAELTRLTQLHPTEARHQIDLARGLQRVGLGEPARAAARRATELEPENADAWNALGEMLIADQLGRLHKPGWDYDGAEAAFRKAKALDPKAWLGPFNLAVLLEFDRAGRRYSPAARLAEAAAEYRAVPRSAQNAESLDQNLSVLLLHLGQHDELAAVARRMQPSEQRDALLATSEVLAHGAAAALHSLSGARDPTRVGRVVQAVAATLLELRRYPEVAQIARSAQELGAPLNLSAFESLARLKRCESLPQREDDPGDLVRRYFLTLHESGTAEALRPFLLSEELLREKLSVRSAEVRMLARQALSPAVMRDLFCSVPPQVEGDAKVGWRVHMELAGELFVVKTQKGLRIAGGPEELGGLALAAIARHDLAAARRWLGFVSREKQEPEVAALLAALGDKPDEAALEAAAATLAADGARPEEAREPLRRCIRKSPKERLVACWKALSVVDWRAKRAEAALTDLDSVLAVEPGWRDGQLRRVTTLLRLGRRAEAEQMVQYLQRHPGEDPEKAAGPLAALYVAEQDCSSLRLEVGKLLDNESLSWHFRNEYAWCALLEPAVSDGDLAQARRAVDDTHRLREAELNTLAMLLAAHGDLAQARDELRESVLPGAPLEEDAWLVLGRLAEAYGLVDEAKGAYARLARPATPRPRDPWSIAQARLQKLK